MKMLDSIIFLLIINQETFYGKKRSFDKNKSTEK